MTDKERLILTRPLGAHLLLQLASKGQDVSRHAIAEALTQTGDIPRLSLAELAAPRRQVD